MNTSLHSQLDTSKRYFVTGGAGFIGSHMVERLGQAGCTVTVYDNLSTGSRKWLATSLSGDMTFVEADLRDRVALDNAISGHDVVFHFAAYADTQRSGIERQADIQNGTIATWNLLESMAKYEIGELVFASSQLVYGELDGFRVSESSGPLLPLSLYGASKLACEGLISAYSHLFGIQATICRFGNIVGGRMWRGILHDFIHKLMQTPTHLEILGNGQQARNYLLVDHCLDAVLMAFAHQTHDMCRLYNIGNLDTVTATEVGHLVIEEMGLEGVTEITYAGGKRGWRGDVPNMGYDLSRICSLGWAPQLNSAGCLRESIRRIQREITEGLLSDSTTSFIDIKRIHVNEDADHISEYSVKD